jgi:CBS domain-containing protein
MKVGEICNREVVIARKKDTLLEAGKRMREYHVGCLVVIEEEKGQRVPVGMLTDRDILMEVLAESIALEKISVEDIMISDLVTAREEDDVYDTIQQMRRKGIRRIPVVDQKQNLIGILAMDDLLELLSEEMKGLSGIFVREQQRETQTRP